MNHSWVSQKSGGLYHLEDEERFDVHGGKFTAFCGATGLFRSVRVDDGLLPFEKCAECLEWKENFAIADEATGNAPVIDSPLVGDGGEVSETSPLKDSPATVPGGDMGAEGSTSFFSAPENFSGSTIENLTRSVIDAEMRAGFKRNISVSSKRDPVYDANGRY